MYSLNRITTVTDCDVLLTWAEREKSDLAYKHYTINRITINYGETSVEIEAVLQGVLAEISAAQIVIDILPDGPTKEAEIKKKVRLEYNNTKHQCKIPQSTRSFLSKYSKKIVP